MHKKINLVIIDKDLLLVSLLMEYFKKNNSFETILSFEKVDEFWDYQNLNISSPDLLLFEPISEPSNGIELIQKLKKREPSINVIAYSFNYQLQYSGHILSSGAKAYCSKKLLPDSLLSILLHVFEHGHYWSASQIDLITSLLSPNIPKHTYPIINRLTKREKEILALLAQQMTTQEIANILYISIKTVDSHKSKILQKTGARNAVGLAIFAIQNQIIRLDEILI